MYKEEITIIAIGSLMGYALYLGYSGVLLTGVVAVLAGPAGYEVKAGIDKKRLIEGGAPEDG